MPPEFIAVLWQGTGVGLNLVPIHSRVSVKAEEVGWGAEAQTETLLVVP